MTDMDYMVTATLISSWKQNKRERDRDEREGGQEREGGRKKETEREKGREGWERGKRRGREERGEGEGGRNEEAQLGKA